jgi:N-acetylmuramic acid 6-phosphate (MurNAc-6-P) etherase
VVWHQHVTTVQLSVMRWLERFVGVLAGLIISSVVMDVSAVDVRLLQREVRCCAHADAISRVSATTFLRMGTNLF